ncbi:MAG: pentapeptide repeat-containing protein [Pseudomonadota bacterium]
MLGKLESLYSAKVRQRKPNDPEAMGEEPWWNEVTLAVAAVDESSKLTRILFTYFLTASLYVAIAVFSTTRETLLVNAGIELPIIGTHVPINAFYVLAPGLFVAFHINLIVKLWTLKKKAEIQANELQERFGEEHGDEPVRTYRELLFPYDFTMIVAGPKGRPLTRAAMGMVIALTVFLGPLALLTVTMQRYAPAGHDLMTVYHGALIIFDAAALVLFRLGLRRRGMVRAVVWTGLQSAFLASIGVAAFLIVVLRLTLEDSPAPVYKAKERSLVQKIEARSKNPYRYTRSNDARKPSGETHTRIKQEPEFANGGARLGKWLLPLMEAPGSFCLVNPSLAPDICPALRRGDLVNDTAYLVASFEEADLEVDEDQRLLSKALEQLCSAASDGLEGRQLDLSGRSLRLVDLNGGVAPCIQFSGADLTGAHFTGAHMVGANFFGANLKGAEAIETYLEGASFGSQADLTEANFSFANLRNAWFVDVVAQQTNFYSSNLSDAEFDQGVLTGSMFFDSTAVDTDFTDAGLSRAVFNYADLSLSNLSHTILLNTTFLGARLINANIRSDFYFGTDFERAVLSGSSLDWSQNYTAGTQEFELGPGEGTMITEWADPNKLLIFADSACFAPLVKVDDTGATCGKLKNGGYVEIDPEIADRKNYRGKRYRRFDEVAVGTEIVPGATLFKDFERAACVRYGPQPIGPDSTTMELQSCWTPEFTERMHWYYCGEMRRRGQTSFRPPRSYSGRPVDSDTCQDIGFGTDEELEWYKAMLTRDDGYVPDGLGPTAAR